MSLINSSAWQALLKHAEEIRSTHLREFFAADPERFQKFSLRNQRILIDFSKQRINSQTMHLLREFAVSADFDGWRQKMLNGEMINHTEKRAVRHITLRAGKNAPIEVQAVLERMKDFCERIHSGQWRGFSGERITDVINIGIGGSDLGPRMAVKALSAQQHPDINVHFVSNVDSADLVLLLERLNPRTALFVISSKTFTTQETLINAQSARAWIVDAAGTESAIAKHFIAVTNSFEHPIKFGIATANIFNFWDWVGGRFSIWSAIGLSLAVAIGWRNFEHFLAGAHEMDLHFFNAPPEENLPLTLALISLWNTNFLGADTSAVLPYSQSLSLLPDYMQQLEMESNGKQICRNGEKLGISSAPIIWGGAGTNGQHSFFQLLHQGGRLVPCDFIAIKEADFPLGKHHSALLANCFAQSAVLAFGQTENEVRSKNTPDELVVYKTFPGNQPSSTFLLSALTPNVLGRLLAMFEHKTFCMGILWGINSFDQWGVELGKEFANKLMPVIEGYESEIPLDNSTKGLISSLREL